MFIFKIPKQVCKGITDGMSHFWWGNDAANKKMHWLAWWKMCVPKKRGGMGFRDIHCFNLALLSKQACRLIENPESLCATVLRARYYPSGDLLNAEIKKGSSFTWQSIFEGIKTLQKGHIWRVGDGSNINIWEDEWIPNCSSRKVITRRGQNILSKVSELINPNTNQWDEDLIHQMFWPVDVQMILSIPLPSYQMDDFVAWSLTRSGTFSMKTANHAKWEAQYGHRINHGLVEEGTVPHPIWDTIWKLKVPAKVKIFTWRIMRDIIPCE